MAYASQALSIQEKRYVITELETLAVVWAMSHFHSYLYGHDITVLTDHSTVKLFWVVPEGVANMQDGGHEYMELIYKVLISSTGLGEI